MRGARVMVVEDDPMMAEAILELLDADPRFEAVGCAQSARAAIELAREARPRVALVDVVLPGGGGAYATRGLLKLNEPPFVLALSAAADRATVIEMLSAGALGYLVKGGPADELTAAISRTASSQPALCWQASAALIDHLLGETPARADRAGAQRIRGEVGALIDGGELTIVFQPIVRLDTRTAVGYEALSRFPHSARRPVEWFADALRAGVLVELELAALEASIEEIEAIGPAWPDGAFLALNVSPITLASTEFAGWLDAIEPLDLVLEVTEHAAIEDYVSLGPNLARLRERGIRFAVDDAGTGYSSLRRILRIGPELIKLDISLTRGIDRSAAGSAMAAAVLSFAEKTGAAVISEGVETEAELETLLSLGARLGQGYLFARPAPLSGQLLAPTGWADGGAVL